MRKVVLLLTVAVAAIALIAAGAGTEIEQATPFAPGQTVEAYAYVHGGYIGQVVITTDDAGEISATLDEAFMPHTLAIVDMDSDDWNEDNTVYYVQRGSEVRVAKHISYNGTPYTGVTVGGALVYVESDEEGNPVGSTDLEMQIIRNEDNMAAWFENIADGRFEIFTEFGGTPEAVTTTSYGSLFKRGSEYWNFGIGWLGNMEALEEAAEQIGTGYTLSEMTRGEDDYWALADAVTGATLSDFKDYFGLIQRGVGRLSFR